MKNRFAVFSIRFLAILLLGIFLLLLHAVAHNPICAVFTPRCASPWELSKLVYWPMLVAFAIPTNDGGGKKKESASWLPWQVIGPGAAVAIFWVFSAFRPGAGVYLLTWIIVSAVALTLALYGVLASTDRSVWMVLIVALGIAYIILTFLPPMVGPFLDPTDVAALATISS